MSHIVSSGTADTLVFAERLPAGVPGESPDDTEARVRLDLELNAPLPLERLAYGWVRLANGDVLYYAMPVERLPAHEAGAPVGGVVPDAASLVLPEGLSLSDLNGMRSGPFADLRPRDVLAEIGRRAAADRVLARVAGPLRIAAALAVVLLAVDGGLAAYNAWREQALAAEADSLKQAESRADALSTLDRLSGGGRSVFDALAVVNAHRPEAVSFSRVVFSDNRELIIEGRAAGVADINRMSDALRASGHFGVVETPKLDTARGRSSFRMRLTMSRWPKLADEPASAPSTVESPVPGAAPAVS